MTRNRILINEHRLCLLSFENIFAKVEIPLLNDIHEYDLLKHGKLDLRNRDSKKLIYHHLIHTLCDTVIRYQKRYKFDVVIVYDNIFTESSQICDFLDCDVLYKQISAVLKKIQSILPVTICKCTDVIDSTYLQAGEGIDCINDIRCNVEKKSRCTNFSKINDFTKQYELTFLNEKYFNKLNTKTILY